MEERKENLTTVKMDKLKEKLINTIRAFRSDVMSDSITVKLDIENRAERRLKYAQEEEIYNELVATLDAIDRYENRIKSVSTI